MTPLGIRVLGSAETLPRRVVPTAEVAALLVGTGSGTHYGALIVQW